jgi:hypothetical protein
MAFYFLSITFVAKSFKLVSLKEFGDEVFELFGKTGGNLERGADDVLKKFLPVFVIVGRHSLKHFIDNSA